jgi:hypothetical protein
VAHRRQRKREAAPWQRKADENEEEEMAVAIKILKRVVLSFRCAKNNKTLFRIQFNLFRVSFRHHKTILRTRPSHFENRYFKSRFFARFLSRSVLKNTIAMVNIVQRIVITV